MISAAGFTIAELLIAMAITLAVTAAVFGLIDPARGAFQAQPEISDMHQRLRVAVDALAHDLLMAGAGVPATSPAVLPYRIGERASDPGAGIFYRRDAISAVYVPWMETAITSRTYYLRNAAGTGTPELMRYDGVQTDLPVVDHVVRLGFQYFDADQTLDPGVLQDGPWLSDEPGAPPFDADLLRIRRIRVLLRVQAVLAAMRGPAGPLFTRGGTATSPLRYAPDQELQFDIALRNVKTDR
jgi:hypothetical protein